MEAWQRTLYRHRRSFVSLPTPFSFRSVQIVKYLIKGIRKKKNTVTDRAKVNLALDKKILSVVLRLDSFVVLCQTSCLVSSATDFLFIFYS